MKKLNNLLTIIIFFGLFLLTFSFDLPFAWSKSGNREKSYEMGVQTIPEFKDKKIVTIKSIDTVTNGFGTLTQTSLAEKFIGKRVRISGYMKTTNVKDWAGIWLNVTERESDKPISFDNMYDRPIKGSVDWMKCEIVVDVPLKSSLMSYGILLSGTGQIWFRDLKFEVVDYTIPTTGKGNEHFMPATEPTNLDFQK